MKLVDIIKVVAHELGTTDLKEINKLLKKEPAIKFRITGKALGHFGFTGQIKSLTEEGVKAFMANKVSLIKLADIESFEKAKPRVERPVRSKAEAAAKAAVAKRPGKKAKAVVDDLSDDDDEDFDDDESFGDEEDFEDEIPLNKKRKKNKTKPVGKSGSRFIPAFKK